MSAFFKIRSCVAPRRRIAYLKRLDWQGIGSSQINSNARAPEVPPGLRRTQISRVRSDPLDRARTARARCPCRGAIRRTPVPRFPAAPAGRDRPPAAALRREAPPSLQAEPRVLVL